MHDLDVDSSSSRKLQLTHLKPLQRRYVQTMRQHNLCHDTIYTVVQMLKGMVKDVRISFMASKRLKSRSNRIPYVKTLVSGISHLTQTGP